jgi:transposase
MFGLYFTRNGLEALTLDHESAEPLVEQADFLYSLGESLQRLDAEIKSRNSELRDSTCSS